MVFSIEKEHEVYLALSSTPPPPGDIDYNSTIQYFPLCLATVRK